jgi:hypothetical protein
MQFMKQLIDSNTSPAFAAFARSITCICWVAGAGAAILIAQPTGQIKGSIQSETKAPLSKVIVSALIRPDAKNSDPKPFSAIATSATDGTFTLTSIPAGTFVICAQLPGSDFLNPCLWSSTSPKTVVNGGQTVNLPVIQLRKGAHFRVSLNDDDGALAANHAKTPGADLLIGIWSPSGQFVRLPALTKDASGWELDLAVPYDTPLPFHLNSKYFSLAAEGGASVDAVQGLKMTIKIPAGTTVPALVFHVKKAGT